MERTARMCAALAMALLVTAPGAGLLAQNAPPAAAKRSATARVNGLTMHYDVHGELTAGAVPLLVLHGAYMSADAMTPFTQPLSRTRPVIVPDLRGHGRTGDGAGPITYERMADDAVAMLDAAGVRQVDVLGYSMGGGVALQLAIRHPARVRRIVSISASTRLDAAYPEIIQAIAQMTPAVFDGTPMRREYDRLAPRPQDFPVLVEKLKALDAAPFAWDSAMRSLAHKTMIVMGDYDIVRPEHAVEMFRMRGGGDAAVASRGFLMESPPARLLILPATSHIGVVAEAETIVTLVIPFLDDATPRMPPGFF